VVIGILKGFVGLSGAVYTQLYLAFYGGEDPESLILLIAWLPAAVSVVFVHTVRYLPYPRRRGGEETSTNPFFCFLYLSIALACFLLVMIVVQRQVPFSREAYGLAATPLLILLLMPLGVVVKQEYKIHRERQLDDALRAAGPPPTITVVAAADAASNAVQMSSSSSKNKTELQREQPVAPPTSRPTPTPSSPPPSSCLGRFGGCVRTMFRPPARGEDHSILQAVVSVDMLVLFAAAMCGVGGTLTAIDNMGQIGQSLGYPSRSTNTFVSLISIWNYAGRVTAGYASEAVLTRHRVPRPLLLTLVLLLACAGHLLIASGAPRSLYAASVVVGFCFGAQWPLVFAVISELFGLKRYSTLHNFGGMASPVGAYLLNVRVAGRLYDAEAARQRGGGACLGVECFRRSFLIIAAATALGAVVSLVLVWRTWGFYRGDIYARFRDGDEGAAAGDRLPVGQPPRPGAEGEEAAAAAVK